MGADRAGSSRARTAAAVVASRGYSAAVGALMVGALMGKSGSRSDSSLPAGEGGALREHRTVPWRLLRRVIFSLVVVMIFNS